MGLTVPIARPLAGSAHKASGLKQELVHAFEIPEGTKDLIDVHGGAGKLPYAEGYRHRAERQEWDTSLQKSFTLIGWSQVPDIDGPGPLFIRKDYRHHPEFSLRTERNGLIQLTSLWDGKFNRIQSAQVVKPHQPFSVAVVFDAKTHLLRLFVNGALAAQKELPQLNLLPAPRGHAHSSGEFTIAEAGAPQRVHVPSKWRMYQRALSDSEIVAHYNDGKGIAYTNF